MRASLVINGVDIGPYIAEDGLSFSKIERVTKELTAKDGTLYRRTVEKQQIDVTFMDYIYDDIVYGTDHYGYKEIVAACTPNPATVSYNDPSTGTSFTNKTFYITAPAFSVSKSFATYSVIDGAGLTLQEQ